MKTDDELQQDVIAEGTGSYVLQLFTDDIPKTHKYVSLC